MAITLGVNICKRDFNIYLITLELGIGSLRLNEEFTISLNSE